MIQSAVIAAAEKSIIKDLGNISDSDDPYHKLINNYHYYHGIDKTWNLLVKWENAPPTSEDNTVSTDEDIAYTFLLTDFAFSDPDVSDQLEYVKITKLESDGSLKLDGVDVILDQEVSRANIVAGKLMFVPDLNENGIGYAEFMFKVSDGVLYSILDYTMTIDVAAVNDPPTSADNPVTLWEDIAHTFIVGDFPFNDVDGDSLSHVKIMVVESVGNLTWDGVDVAADDEIPVADIVAGKLVFTPVLNDYGEFYDNFDFMVKDGFVYSVSDYTILIGVKPQNDAPVAVDDTAVTYEDTAVTIDVLDNDYDVDGDTLFLKSFSASSFYGGVIVRDNNGTPGVTSDDKLVYTPPLDFISPPDDTFLYTISDSTVLTDTATVTITVTEENDPPASADNTVSTDEDIAYTFLLTDFAFSDPDVGDQLEYVKITQLESDGSLKLDGVDVILDQGVSRADILDGKLAFIPDLNENGIGYADFKFKVSDGVLYSVLDYTMTIDVNAVNDPPTSADNTVSTDEDIAYTFLVGDFPFADVDGDSLSHVKVTVLEGVGDLTWDGVDVAVDDEIPVADIVAGKLVFTPVLNGNGVGYDSFDFMVKDGTVYSVLDYTMTVDVTAVNDPPVADDQSVITNQDTSIVITLTGSDIDGSIATYTIESLPSDGSLWDGPTIITAVPTDLSANTVEYQPDPDYFGDDIFTFTATDDGTPPPGQISPPATVDITVLKLHHIDLKPDWNMISIPCYENIDKSDVIIRNNSIDYTWDAAVTAGIILDYIYDWDRVNQNYKDPSLVNTFEPGRGYRMQSYFDCELIVLSNAVGSGEITYLNKNWSMVGLPYDSALNKEDIIVNYDGFDHTWSQAIADNVLLQFIYDWDTVNQYYLFSDALEPTYGYWMFAYQECTLKKII